MDWRRQKPGCRTLRLCLVLLAAVLCLMPAAPLQATEGRQRIAVFDFELLDTSLEGDVAGENSAQSRRLTLISDLLRQKLSESGRYDLVDVAPARDRIEDVGYLRACNGCDAQIAQSLGAQQSLTGVVQKVSNLILNINLYLRDAENGALLKVMSADIRGNTDQSWSRGVSWLVRNRLLKD